MTRWIDILRRHNCDDPKVMRILGLRYGTFIRKLTGDTCL